MLPRCLAPAIVPLLIAGCSGGLGEGLPDTIAVQSEPPGAVVIVMGQELGTTPLAIPVKSVFPAVYAPELEAQYGRIMVKKSGCSDYVTTVDGNVLGRGLKVQLECAATAAAPPETAAPTNLTPDTPPTTLMPGERLRQLDDIFRHGLISDEEYQQLRRRILDTL
jgi:hypothetical protein